MNTIFSKALQVKNLFGVAIFSLILLYFFKDNIQALAMAGKSDAMNLLLGFLFFTVIGIVLIAGYYAISASEVERGTVTVRKSKGVDTKLKGGGTVDVRDSEDVKTDIDNSGSNASPEKKT